MKRAGRSTFDFDQSSLIKRVTSFSHDNNDQTLDDFFKSCPFPACQVAIGTLYSLGESQFNKTAFSSLPNFIKTFSSKFDKNPKRLLKLLKDYKLNNSEFVNKCCSIIKIQSTSTSR